MSRSPSSKRPRPRKGPTLSGGTFRESPESSRLTCSRRIAVHSVDLRKRPIAAGELQRFVQKFGARALLDEDGKAYRDKGLAHMRLDDAEIVQRLLADARLIRLPLVRHGNECTAGPAEATWAAWLRTPADARSGGRPGVAR